jgi:hypothetical protein
MWFSWARKLNNRFEEQWGCGDPGKIATEHLTEVPQWRPKGIPKLALVASLVDPRFKFGPGFSDFDKTYIWNIIRQMMTYLVVGENQREEEHLVEEDQQQQQPRTGIVDNENEDVVSRVNAELLLYKRE